MCCSPTWLLLTLLPVEAPICPLIYVASRNVCTCSRFACQAPGICNPKKAWQERLWKSPRERAQAKEGDTEGQLDEGMGSGAPLPITGSSTAKHNELWT